MGQKVMPLGFRIGVREPWRSRWLASTKEFAGFLDGEYSRVIHVGLGDVVLQFIQPLVEEGSWYEQLKTKGPGVHNLTYIVDDMEATVKALGEEGISPLFLTQRGHGID